MDLTFYQRKITYAFLKLSISLSIIHIDFPKIDDSAAPKLSTTDTLFRHTLHIYLFIYLFIYLLAHLSRRLIGELIVYQWSGVRRPSVVRPSSVRRRPQCSKIFFSETAGPIKAKFYVEPPWVGGNDILFATSGSIFTKLGM